MFSTSWWSCALLHLFEEYTLEINCWLMEQGVIQVCPLAKQMPKAECSQSNLWYRRCFWKICKQQKYINPTSWVWSLCKKNIYHWNSQTKSIALLFLIKSTALFIVPEPSFDLIQAVIQFVHCERRRKGRIKEYLKCSLLPSWAIGNVSTTLYSCIFWFHLPSIIWDIHSAKNWSSFV